MRVGFLCLACLVVACGGGSGSPADSGIPDVPADPGWIPEGDLPGEEGRVDSGTDARPPDGIGGPDGTDGGPEIAPPTGVLRFVHLSDVHVWGDAARPDPSHVVKAVARLNQVDFPADLVVVTGDLVDYLADDLRPEDESTLRIALRTLEGLKWPVRVGVGNHEYYRDAMLQVTADKAARDAWLSGVLGTDLDFAVVQNGVRLVMMNSMAGDQWSSSSGLVGSFTGPQLAWLREQAADGTPTILLFHHPPVEDLATGGRDTLCQVITDHPGVFQGVFAGHLHGFWKGTFCGLPYYLVRNVDPSGVFYYLVEYDASARRLSIVNEADIPFQSLPEFRCDPSEGTLEDPATLVDTVHVLHLGTLSTNLPGLTGFNGDGLDDMPFVFRVDSWDAGTRSFQGRITFARRQSGWYAYLDSVSCVDFPIQVDGPCGSGGPVRIDMDLAPLLRALLDVPLDPSWHVRLEVQELTFKARFDDSAGVPRAATGLIEIHATGRKALDDLDAILAGEYCKGAISGCVPGSSAAMPPCQGDPPAVEPDAVPEECDVLIGGYSLRFLKTFLSSYPLDNMLLVGEAQGTVAPESPTPVPGAIDPLVFDTAPGRNCGP